MSNEAIYIRELPTLDFIMRENSEQKMPASATENQKIGIFFYWLAAAQIAQILIGAVLSFFVAPASLFVSRTDDEAFAWIAAAFIGFAVIALGLILIVLSIVAARAFRKEKSRRNVIGIITAGLAIFAFPFGTISGSLLLRKILRNYYAK